MVLKVNYTFAVKWYLATCLLKAKYAELQPQFKKNEWKGNESDIIIKFTRFILSAVTLSSPAVIRVRRSILIDFLSFLFVFRVHMLVKIHLSVCLSFYCCEYVPIPSFFRSCLCFWYRGNEIYNKITYKIYNIRKYNRYFYNDYVRKLSWCDRTRAMKVDSLLLADQKFSFLRFRRENMRRIKNNNLRNNRESN